MKKPVIHMEQGGEGEAFYMEIMKFLKKNKISFIIGGTYALRYYTGIERPTKDIDIFCKAGDYPKILKLCAEHGYSTEILDDRWLAKIHKGKYFIDIIFGSISGTWSITDDWLDTAPKGKIADLSVLFTPPEQLIVSKLYRMGRNHFDGADVTHMFLKQGKKLKWKMLLNLIEPYWEVLLVQILLFRFTYPSDRDVIPAEILHELLDRIHAQIDIPTPKEKICRGSLLSHRQYDMAYTQWGYKDVTQFDNRIYAKSENSRNR